VLTAHTRDDQAETVLIRMSRGSGLTGLAAMSRFALMPGDGQIRLVRPLLDIPKSRLVATLRAAKIAFADDPSNRDPRFARVRLRGLMPELAREGIDARRLAVLSRRLKRADRAIEAAADRAEQEVATHPPGAAESRFDAPAFAQLPAEIALRLLARAVTKAGDEGPVELAKLEALHSALESAQKSGNARFRRSLAGALVTLVGAQLVVARAPPRRRRNLTTGGRGKAKSTKTR
jgi:tRNA(Ile)-lysidine synthase